MPSRRKRTPQEKKSLSIKKDRRSTYEYPKSARKNVPRKKAKVSRQNRRRVKRAIHPILQGDQEAEGTTLVVPRKKPRLSKAIPLADHIAKQRASARSRAGRRTRHAH